MFTITLFIICLILRSYLCASTYDYFKPILIVSALPNSFLAFFPQTDSSFETSHIRGKLLEF